MLQPRPARLPAPLATGSLAQKPVAHLLVYALERKLTGTFELDDEGREGMHLTVEGGLVARVATSDPLAYLGHVLYELGVIDGAALSASLAEVASTRRLHGQVLLARGLITTDNLATGLRRQRIRKLDHAFRLSTQAKFSFYAGVDLIGARPGDVEPMNPLAAIWRGLRANPAWDHVRSTMATIGGRPLRVTGSIDHLGFDVKERVAAERLAHAPTTVSELATGARLDMRSAELFAYFLVITSLAEITEPVARRGPPPLPPPSHPSTLGAALQSGEYARKVSFSMRATVPDATPLRIPSPAPIARVAIAAQPRASRLERPTPYRPDATATVRESATRIPAPRARDSEAHGRAAEEASAAEKAIVEAEIHLALGDRRRAGVLVRSALAMSPAMPSALALLAHLEVLTLSDGQEAYLRDLLRIIDAAIVRDARCRRGHFYRAEVKKRLKDHEGAIRDLCLAVKNDPEDSEAVHELRVYEAKVREGSVMVRSRSPAAGTPAQSLPTRRLDSDEEGKPTV